MYRTRGGRLPFDEWLRRLDDANAVAGVLARIGRVRRGNLGDSKSVGGGVFEFVSITGRGIGCTLGSTEGLW